MQEMAVPETQASVSLNGTVFSYGEMRRVVDTFYRLVARDPVLQVPFQTVKDWPEHIERMTHFWWTKFGGAPYLRYQYDPVSKHFAAGFNRAFLSRWLTLFHETLHLCLSQEQFELWALIAERMGQGLSYKNELYRQAHEEAGSSLGAP
jgi:hemoglobin